MAELLLNPDDRRTKGQKMQEVGVPERTFYRWMKDPRYIEYINKQLDRYTDGELVEVWKSLLNQAKRGNIQAIKLFFELKKLYVERHEHTGKDGKPIEFTNLSDEELDAKIERLMKQVEENG